MSRSAFILLAALVVVSVGCDNIDYIDVEPSTVSLRTKNDSVWLHALGKSQQGREYPKSDMTWTVKDPSIAQVDRTGLVRPLKSGQTDVVVSHGSVKASVPVEVVFAEKLVVTPASITLQDGEDGQEIKAKVYDARGRELKDRTPIYIAKDPKIVSMGGNKAFPLNPGKTDVEVKVEDVVQHVEVTVEASKTAKR